MSAKKILMIVGDYVEDYEAMVPFQALSMVGHASSQTPRACGAGASGSGGLSRRSSSSEAVFGGSSSSSLLRGPEESLELPCTAALSHTRAARAN